MTGTTVEWNEVDGKEVLDIHLSPYHSKIFEMIENNLQECGPTLAERLIINEWAAQQERSRKMWELEPNE